MDINFYLDKSLIKINNEVNLFNPRNKLLKRKYSDNSNSIISDWMENYCAVYHKLFFEFNPSKLKFKELKKNQSKQKIPPIELLLEDLCVNYLEKIENVNCNRQLIIDLKKIFKLKKSNNVIQELSEWFNIYSDQIYNSINRNNTQQLSFIQYLEHLLQNNSRNNSTNNSTNNSRNNLSNNSRNTKDVARFKELLKLIIQQLNKFNQFTSFKIQLEIQNEFNFMYYYNDSELEFTIYSHTEIQQDNIYWRFLYARMKSVLKLYHKKIQSKQNNTPIDTKIKFEIYLSEQIKQLPRKRKIFGPEEVNSGSTNFETINV